MIELSFDPPPLNAAQTLGRYHVWQCVAVQVGKGAGLSFKQCAPFGDHHLELPPSYPRSYFGGGHGGGFAVRNVRPPFIAVHRGAPWYLLWGGWVRGASWK